MLIFEAMLIQSLSCFWACLFSKNAYFQKRAYYRASTVIKTLLPRLISKSFNFDIKFLSSYIFDTVGINSLILVDFLGWKFLRELEKGKYADSDTYVTHEIIPLEQRQVLLISNRRVLYMTFQNVMGTWTVDWEYMLTDITLPCHNYQVRLATVYRVVRKS